MYNIKKIGDRIYVEARYFILHIYIAHPYVGVAGVWSSDSIWVSGAYIGSILVM